VDLITAHTVEEFLRRRSSGTRTAGRLSALWVEQQTNSKQPFIQNIC